MTTRMEIPDRYKDIAIDYQDYDFESMRGITGTITRGKKTYCDDFMCFDIETTRAEIGKKEIINGKIVKSDDYHEFSFMYVWQLNIFGEVVLGRTWEEFSVLMNAAKRMIDGTIIVYVHNLSYEFQFLKPFFVFDKILATSERRIIAATSRKFEFRCSLRLFNSSLEQTAKIWGDEIKKGKMDYDVYRDAKTFLRAADVDYMITDVVAQRDSIKNRMKASGDTTASIPYTSTGYVRREVKERVGYLKLRDMRQAKMTREVYQLLSEAFRGGNTHANRFYANEIISNVYCDDVTSSYPHSQISGYYPVQTFLQSPCNNLLKFEEKIERCCALIRVRFYGISLINPYDGFPPMSVHKCRKPVNTFCDNGRVLSADAISVTLTDVDYKIFKNHYKWERYEIECVYTSRRGQLPDEMKAVIFSFFERKTALKGIEDRFFEYQINKEYTNSIYGMSAQKPVFYEWQLENGKLVACTYLGVPLYKATEKDIIEAEIAALNYDGNHRVMPYQYGVWVTANSRMTLEEGIREDTLYVDTDSSYSCRKISPFKAYNRKWEEYYKERNMQATDIFGNIHTLGTFLRDEKMYDQFITLGAKKYAGVIDGKISITVAGVNKKAGAKYLEEHGGLEAFRKGFVFDVECNAASAYNDEDDFMYRGQHITSNVSIYKTSYKLGLTRDYEDLILNSHNYTI